MSKVQAGWPTSSCPVEAVVRPGARELPIDHLLLPGDDARAARPALLFPADDVGAAGAGREHRFWEQVGGRVADVRAGCNLLPHLEVDRAAGRAHAHDRAG